MELDARFWGLARLRRTGGFGRLARLHRLRRIGRLARLRCLAGIAAVRNVGHRTALSEVHNDAVPAIMCLIGEVEVQTLVLAGFDGTCFLIASVWDYGGLRGCIPLPDRAVEGNLPQVLVVGLWPGQGDAVNCGIHVARIQQFEGSFVLGDLERLDIYITSIGRLRSGHRVIAARVREHRQRQCAGNQQRQNHCHQMGLFQCTLPYRYHN